MLLFLFPFIVFGNTIWGKTGHRVTGQIAQEYLTGKTKRALNDLLDGHSLAFISTFADDIKADRAYSKYSAWHYVNYPLGMRYRDSEKSEYGDIVTAIEECIFKVKDKKNTREDRIFHLKMLVHLIGDLHQPMHASRAKDKGGNDIQVQWFGEGSNLHRVWDKNLIESYGMTYTELASELDGVNRKERKKSKREPFMIGSMNPTKYVQNYTNLLKWAINWDTVTPTIITIYCSNSSKKEDCGWPRS